MTRVPITAGRHPRWRVLASWLTWTDGSEAAGRAFCAKYSTGKHMTDPDELLNMKPRQRNRETTNA